MGSSTLARSARPEQIARKGFIVVGVAASAFLRPEKILWYSMISMSSITGV
jgi:hypothetical protein